MDSHAHLLLCSTVLKSLLLSSLKSLSIGLGLALLWHLTLLIKHEMLMANEEEALDNINLYSVITIISFILWVPCAIFLEGIKFTPYVQSAIEDCIKDFCNAVERERELRSNFKMIARALTSKRTALVKISKCSKDYGPSVEIFPKINYRAARLRHLEETE